MAHRFAGVPMTLAAAATSSPVFDSIDRVRYEKQTNLRWHSPIANVNFEEAEGNPFLICGGMQRRYGPGVAILDW